MAERAEATRIELLDITGQIRFRGSASGRTVIPIGHLPKGVYLLRLENSTHRELRKIVRN